MYSAHWNWMSKMTIYTNRLSLRGYKNTRCPTSCKESVKVRDFHRCRWNSHWLTKRQRQIKSQLLHLLYYLLFLYCKTKAIKKKYPEQKSTHWLNIEWMNVRHCMILYTDLFVLTKRWVFFSVFSLLDENLRLQRHKCNTRCLLT